MFVAELCVLRTFGGVDFSLTFICAQSVPEFLWDTLRASIQFPVTPKGAQYARFSGGKTHNYSQNYGGYPRKPHPGPQRKTRRLVKTTVML